ncbi:hypothetical protein QU38_01330, partial [Staphylococcus aureus]
HETRRHGHRPGKTGIRDDALGAADEALGCADRRDEAGCLETHEAAGSGTKGELADPLGRVLAAIAGHHCHACADRDVLGVDRIDAYAIAKIGEEGPPRDIDHGQRHDAIFVGALIGGGIAGADADHDMVAIALLLRRNRRLG